MAVPVLLKLRGPVRELAAGPPRRGGWSRWRRSGTSEREEVEHAAPTEGSALPGPARQPDPAAQSQLVPKKGAWPRLGPTGYGTPLAAPHENARPRPHPWNDGSRAVPGRRGAPPRRRRPAAAQPSRLGAVAPHQRAPRATRSRSRLGGMMGLGSYIYGLLTPSASCSASRSSSTRPAQQRCDHHRGADGADVLVRVGGTPGAILVLLALHALAPANRSGRSPLELALACARHLLANRIPRRQQRAWGV